MAHGDGARGAPGGRGSAAHAAAARPAREPPLGIESPPSVGAAVRPHASSRAWAVARCSASCSAHRVSEAAIACMSCVTRRERARPRRCARSPTELARGCAMRGSPPRTGRDHGHGGMRPAAGDACGPACGLRCALRVQRGGVALAAGPVACRVGGRRGTRRRTRPGPRPRAAGRQSRIVGVTTLWREEGLVGIPGCGVTTNELIRRLE